jgi:nickel transport protein
MRRLFATLAVVALATAAHAHQLNVFAFVQDDEVIVETKFSSGKIPVSGEVRVLDGAGQVLSTLSLETDGTVRFPLDPNIASEGLTIEVSTGDGHDDYWILTPSDIANGSGS